MKKLCCLLFLFPLLCFSQTYQQPNAAQIRLKLKKLNFLGSVLYMAAHPDDENTDIITFLANDRLATTGYLALTRGDGGQNLIGPEIRDLLGLIRTQELLAARRIDGGQQFFTRANDFGFSKSADEAFQIWGKNEILSDVVKIFRQFKPDIILTRFPPDERAGHGHHTASAILAGEGFDAAAKPDAFPEYAKEFGTWQVKRLYTNTGRWWNKDINENTPNIITLDVGGFNPLLGKSYTEISALSSSQHKSQGWGRRGKRGYNPEFLEHVKGERAQKDIFEGVVTTWARVKGGEKIQILVDRVIKDFSEGDPAASVPLLLQIKKELNALENGVWKKRKLLETDQLIQDCLGLFIEVTSTSFRASPGQKIKTSIELVNRSANDIKLDEISSQALHWDTAYSNMLKPNNLAQVKSSYPTIDAAKEYSDPYWLKKEHGTGLFTVSNRDYIGLPENPPAVDFDFTLNIGGEKLTIKRPLIYKWVDPVKGELWRPFEIVPPVFVNPADKVVIFNSNEPKEISFTVRSSGEEMLKGNLSLEVPAGWKAEPASQYFEFTKPGEEQRKSFVVHPSSKEFSGSVQAFAEVNGKKFDKALQLVNYDHIPIQTLLPVSAVKAIRINLKKEGNVIGYVKGAGDDIPAALRNMGFEVWEMKDNEITAANLKRVDAVVLGVRALNTNDRIRFFMDDLLEYVKNGGTLVVQYNNNFDLETEKFSPYTLKLGRDRVTQEDSEVRILKPDHPVLNIPNKITPKDFEGWVQERGLYYPSQWDQNFEAILSMNDKGETPKDGSLLIAKYGQGNYVYTGLSFFRELPEGIPGAYKLFANIVSLGKAKKVENTKVKSKAK
jgi:LmbE family N-acetylglucosaminyl deacetylase